MTTVIDRLPTRHPVPPPRDECRRARRGRAHRRRVRHDGVGNRPASVATIALPLGALQGITQGALLGLFMVLVGVATWRMTGQEWVSGVPGAGR